MIWAMLGPIHFTFVGEILIEDLIPEKRFPVATGFCSYNALTMISFFGVLESYFYYFYFIFG